MRLPSQEIKIVHSGNLKHSFTILSNYAKARNCLGNKIYLEQGKRPGYSYISSTKCMFFFADLRSKQLLFFILESFCLGVLATATHSIAPDIPIGNVCKFLRLVELQRRGASIFSVSQNLVFSLPPTSGTSLLPLLSTPSQSCRAALKRLHCSHSSVWPLLVERQM